MFGGTVLELRSARVDRRRIAAAVAAAVMVLGLAGIESASASSSTVTPAAISQVDQRHPSSVLDNGTLSTTSRLGAQRQAFFRIDVRAIPRRASNVRATLSVHANEAVKSTTRVYWSNNSLSGDPGGYWKPSNLTWHNKPDPHPSSATLLGSRRATSAPGWVNIDVTDLIKRNGQFSIVLQTDGPEVYTFAGAGSADAPRLRLRWEGGASPSSPTTSSTAPPTTAPPTTITPTPSSTTTTSSVPPASTTTTMKPTTTTTVATPPPAVPGVVKPRGVPGDWALQFNDEFNGTSLDLNKWSNCWFSPGCGRQNNVSTSPSNVSVTNGALVLTLSSPSSGASVSTNPRGGAKVGYQFRYGVVEARIHFPGDGANCYNWPAWWTNGQDHPRDGENDIAEVLSSGDLSVNYHSLSGTYNQGAVRGYWCDGYHTYTMHRRAGHVDVYYDGGLVKSYSTDDGGALHYLLLNVGAKGIAAYGAASQVKVDYVRAWQ